MSGSTRRSSKTRRSRAYSCSRSLVEVLVETLFEAVLVAFTSDDSVRLYAANRESSSARGESDE
jgi:membrane-bound inhibitor of C-type lysozyme